MAKSLTSDQIKTPTFIASYPDVIEPKPSMNDGSKLEYSVTMLFPKATTDLSVITNVIKGLREKAFTQEVTDPVTKVKSIRPISPEYLQLPLRDGDAPNTKGVIVESNKGMWVMKAKSLYAPVVVDRDGKTVIRDKALIQAGNIMRGLVQFYAYDNKKRGVGVTLLSVFKMGDGEPLAGGQGGVSPSVWADDVAPTTAGSLGLDL